VRPRGSPDSGQGRATVQGPQLEVETWHVSPTKWAMCSRQVGLNSSELSPPLTNELALINSSLSLSPYLPRGILEE
jgi:hypothetical protein